MNPITLAVNYVEQDFVDFAGAQSKKVILILAIVSFVFAFLQMATFLISSEQNVDPKETTAAVVRVGIYILLLASLGAILVFLMKRNAKRSFAALTMFHHEVRFIMTDSGLLAQGHDFEFESDWADLQRIREFNKTIAIYYNRASALLIPKREIESDTILHELRSVLAASGVKKVKLMDS